ncbi:MAG TPA: ribose 5-phosphate isomerase B [Candidatus Omnitrophica bacterium]|nr:ribose 5-phosphate isomerase B [Candidatus Omnitrophota bacterium]
MKISIASDHRGFFLKEKIKDKLSQQGIEMVDVGTYSCDSCDYPDFAVLAIKKFLNGEVDSVILICGSGIGMSIVANKFKGIRAGLCVNAEMAKMAREHNNANVLVLSANFTPEEEIDKIVTNWLNCKFEGGRHERRVNKIIALEEGLTLPEG